MTKHNDTKSLPFSKDRVSRRTGVSHEANFSRTKLVLSVATIAVLGMSSAFAADNLTAAGRKNWIYSDSGGVTLSQMHSVDKVDGKCPEGTTPVNGGKNCGYELTEVTKSGTNIKLNGLDKYKIPADEVGKVKNFGSVLVDGSKATLATGKDDGTVKKLGNDIHSGTGYLNEWSNLQVAESITADKITLTGKTELNYAGAYVKDNCKDDPKCATFTADSVDINFESSDDFAIIKKLTTDTTTINGSGSLVLNNDVKADRASTNLGDVIINGGTIDFNVMNKDQADSLKIKSLTAADGSKFTIAKNADTIASKTLNTSTISSGDKAAKELNLGTIKADGSFFSEMDDSHTIIAGGGSNIRGNLAMSKGTIKVSAGTIDLNSANLSETFKFDLNGATLNVANGLIAENKTAANANLLISAGGTINFNGGNSSLGEIKISATNFNVKGGSLSLAKAELSDSAKLTLNGGTLNFNDELTTKKSDNLALTSGTVNFNGGDSDTATKFTIKDKLDASKVTLNVNNKAEFADLTELTVGTVNFNEGSSLDYKGQLKTGTDEIATLNFGSNGSATFSGTISATGTDSISFSDKGFDKLAITKNLNVNSGTVEANEIISAAADSSLLVSNGATAKVGSLKVNTIELDDGTLHLTSDTTNDLQGQTFKFIQNSPDGLNSQIISDKDVKVENATFQIVVAQGVDETQQTSYNLINAEKIESADKATTEVYVRRSLNDIAATAANYGIEVDTTKLADGKKAEDVIDAQLTNKTFTLNDDGTATGASPIIDASTLQKAKQDTIDTLIAFTKSNDTTLSATYKGELETTLNNAKKDAATQSNASLAAETAKNAGAADHSDVLLSAYGNDNSSSANAAVKTLIYNDVVYNGGNGVVKDIKDAATASSNLSSATASVINNINLSNDVSVMGRVAAAGNPYQKARGSMVYYAENEDYADYESASDVIRALPLYYANNLYANGIWANVIGGANIIDGETGGVFGATVGFDNQLENALVGFYLSFVDADLNDKLVEQSSQNIQFGTYVSFNRRTVEVNLKAYGQISPTDLSVKRSAGGDAKGDFVRTYAGASANVGYVAAFNENTTFLKPFVGANYYYAHTPAYDESGGAVSALSVSALNNNALSLELGLDLRKYLGENSYFYITPSIEQYVLNNGGDYTAGFIGSDAVFTVLGDDAKKTYGKAIIGGNINVTEQFNINLGFGVKQIFGGQVDNKNETYLTGNLGVRYKF